MEKPSNDRLTLSPGCKMEDEDITGDCGGEKTMSSTMDGGLHSVDRPWNPSDSEQPRTVRGGAVIQGEETFPCPECGEDFSSKLNLSVHQRSHNVGDFHSSSNVGQSSAYISEFMNYYKSRTGKKQYPCSECEKSFSSKYTLSKHKKLHSGEKPYSCPKCGKCFSEKSILVSHEKFHTGERPFSCPECGKCYKLKFVLFKHLRSHTREKRYSCPK
ncbi:gastrula zinc finger protein XlCGF67.1-like [Rana temporaria]|uniref:gastrula zinc finger protein XlCGF67.1-like n=1 Tax=Rana temporaria TaxID=8407 RepID=UPI001AADAD18|nr:gastrula zinc finger protein XlCGF67.1-like [Rana temporaria]